MDRRRQTLFLAALLLGGAASSSAACPPVGAIRWDAWFGSKAPIGAAVEKSLSPNQWHYRLPTCAREVSPDETTVRCDSQEQMDLEIKQAADAGLSYWAFVAYDEDSPMNLGLRAYLDSKVPNKLRFAVISELSKWGGSTGYPAVIKRYARLMGAPTYLRRVDGRPIFFLAFASDNEINGRWRGRSNLAKAVDELRRGTKEAGAGDPYIVLLEGNVSRAKDLLRDLRLEAVSAYTVSNNRAKKAPYTQLAGYAAKFWADAAAAGLPVVPIAMTGWDRRPRVMNPAPWWETGDDKAADAIDRYYEAPSPAELTTHLGDAMRFAARGGANAVQPVLVYAWNEFDEGGWLAPTKGTGGTRLDAVKRAVKEACPTPTR